MIPVILSGGSGSRLWPLSRKAFPKQFLALTAEQTLFQQTIERLAFEGMQAPLLVCNKEHRFIVKEQLAARKLQTQGLMLEPFGRNTAPAIAIAAMKLLADERDELLLVLPADHVIEDHKAFQRSSPWPPMQPKTAGWYCSAFRPPARRPATDTSSAIIRDATA